MESLASKTELENVKRSARKAAEFVSENSAQIIEMLKNGPSTMPRDLAKVSFYNFVNSNRGRHLMDMFSIEGMLYNKYTLKLILFI